MKKYSMFQAPFKAFYSGAFYRDVGLNRSGSCFGYLFLLLLVCAVPKAVRLQLSLLDFADNSAPALIGQVPAVKIVNGEASSAAPQPYTIRETGTGKPLAIVDTTGATVSLEGSEAFLLIKKTELIVKTGAMDSRTVSFKEIRNFTLDQDLLNYLVGLLCRYGVLLSALLALAGAFIFRIAQALVYGALGLAMAGLLGEVVEYWALVRMSVIAVTPVIIVFTAAGAAGAEIPRPWLLGFCAAMGFLFLGIRSVSARREPPAPAADSQSAPV